VAGLRRTLSTSHSSVFARPACELFTKPSNLAHFPTFYEGSACDFLFYDITSTYFEGTTKGQKYRLAGKFQQTLMAAILAFHPAKAVVRVAPVSSTGQAASR